MKMMISIPTKTTITNLHKEMPNIKKIVTAPLNFAKTAYKKLEQRAAAKAAASPYEWVRVGGSQPMKMRKDRDKRPKKFY
jgi:hypothetical protein